MEEQSNEALWYVVHTYSGYENKVATDLQTMVENRRLQGFDLCLARSMYSYVRLSIDRCTATYV